MDFYILALPALAVGISTYFIGKTFFTKGPENEFMLLTPKNTLIVFDIHGVLFRFSFSRLIKEFFNVQNKRKLIFMLIKPSVLFNSIKIYKQYRTPEACFFKLSELYPEFKEYRNDMITILNCQQMIPSTVEMVKDLYLYGYPMHIMSNIGEKTYKDLEQKNPEVFKYFKEKHFTKASEDYSSKHKKDFFEKKMPTKNKNVVFIDNSRKNTRSAKSLGFKTILYKGKDSLIKGLQTLKIIKP